MQHKYMEVDSYQTVVTNLWQSYWTVVMNLWQAKKKKKQNEGEKSNFQSSALNPGYTDARPMLYQLGYHSQCL